jgi:hypothetical protein
MQSMTRRRKLVLSAGAGAVLLAVAGLGAAGAIAASGLFSPSEDAQALIDDAAAQLGVEPEELSDALRDAYENRIDEAVDDGRLTEEQAEWLKERLQSADALPFFGLGGLHGHGFGAHGHGAGFLAEAAAYLDMTQEELREALRESTLAEIARKRGKSVTGLVDALVATQAKRIDEAVDDGRLSDEQAAGLKNRLEERTEALVNGELRRQGHGGHRFWRGHGSPRGPPHFGGPRG